VEVAGYRILGEALNNFVRHSRALHVDVIVSLDRAADHVPGDKANHLLLTVQERGFAGVRAWQAGLGMASMSERVGELGGTLEAGPTPEGSRVRARLPLESAG
jgi:signal transduction histidine kinase